MDKQQIIIDAMGGDHAPSEIVKGAAEAVQESSTIHCIFVGDQERIGKILEDLDVPTNRYEIIHTSEFIAMDDSPKEAVKSKENASINIAAKLIAEGKGDALVSAGNTGATILACAQTIPRLPGIERTALAAVFPAMKHQPSDPGKTIMLDVGATLHCTTHQLINFTIMGTHYAREVMNISNPRVALLNIGEEETKGHDILVETHMLLRRMPKLNFIGNIEGKDVLRGIADIIVTEGYVGNIVLKALEGVAEIAYQIGQRIWKKGIVPKLGLTMLAPILKKIKKRVDYTEYGGAPILGFEKLVIKCHGRSNAKAIRNALLLAETSIMKNLVGCMHASIREFYGFLLKRAE